MNSSLNIILFPSEPEIAAALEGSLPLFFGARRFRIHQVETKERLWELHAAGEADVLLITLDEDVEDLSSEEGLAGLPWLKLSGQPEADTGENGMVLPRAKASGTLLAVALLHVLEKHDLQRQRERLASRLGRSQRVAAVGDWELNPRTNELKLSDQAYGLSGRDPSTQIDTLEEFFRFLHPDDQVPVAEAILQAFQDGTPFAVRFRLASTEGNWLPLEMEGELEAEDNGSLRWVGSLRGRDCETEVANLNEEKQRIRQALQSRQELLAKTGHEIRTPLNPILGLTDILLTKTDPTPQQREYLNAIKTAGKALRAVVNDMLDFSRIEAGKISFREESFNLTRLFGSLREMLEINLQEKLRKVQRHHPERQIRLVTELDPGIPAFLLGDPVRLSQILLNLAGNAIKFTDEGEIRLEVTCRERGDSSVHLQFRVVDTGIGIPEDKLSSIFDSFRQAGEEEIHRTEGIGLGLAIVKQLVVLQGGSIDVHSRQGEGSAFVFDLRFGIDPHPPEQVEDQPGQDQRLSGLKILVVEDNETNQLVARNILAGWGIEADLADHGAEAIQRVREKAYDLILMDLYMPEMDGFEATRFIRQQMEAPRSQVPIIALTAHAATDIDAQCRAAGMNDYLTKPVKSEQLYNKLLIYARPLQVNGQDHTAAPPPADSLTQAMENPPYTDLSYLEETLGEPFIIKKTIRKFLDTTPDMLDRMDSCLAAKDYHELSRSAHKLKSSIDTMGISALRETIRSIEQQAKNQVAVDQLPALVARTRSIIEASFTELEAKLETR